MKYFSGVTTCVIALATTLAGAARADVVLGGPDANDGSYSPSALQSAANAGDTVNSGGLTGISLWGFLGGASASSSSSPIYGAITTSTPAGDNGKNAILRYYLVATNATGQQSVVSLGAIDPSFGTAATPAFVAYQATGGGLLSAPQLVIPGAAGRGLTNLTSLQLLAVPAASGAGGVSTALTLSGNVSNPGSYDLNRLQTQFTPVTNTTLGVTGVGLWAFLNPTAGSSTNQIVRTVGSDGYVVAVALSEIDPSLGGDPNDLLPYAGNGFPGAGVARTIFPTDNQHGRWESNLISIDVAEAPEPASLVLLAVGLLGLGAARRRRQRGA